MNLKQYLDSTYLKTAAQAGLSEEENLKVAEQCIDEAITEDFKLIMIRLWPEKRLMQQIQKSWSGQ
jgi:deoxyribose-phosphate aldolase